MEIFHLTEKEKPHFIGQGSISFLHLFFFLKAFYDFLLSLLYFLFPSLLFILLKLSSVLSHLL